MKLAEVAERLSSVLSMIHRLESSPGPYEPFILFGPPGYDYGLVGEAQTDAFERALEAILSFENEIRITVSKTRVRELFRSFLWEKFSDRNPREITGGDAHSFIRGMLAEPKVTWEVIRPLFGASLSSDRPIELGPCTIYNWNTYKAYLADRSVSAEGMLDRLAKENTRIEAPGDPLLIGIKIQCRDHQIAQEAADVTLQTVEYVFRYMVSFIHGVKNPISIFEHPQELRRLGIVISQERAEESTQYQSRYGAEFLFGLDLDLADSFFQDERRGFHRLWQALRDGSTADEMSRRILAAATWIGKGISDPDPARRLVQYIFALEALLTFKEKDVLVSPSIAAQMAEFTAFISWTTYLDRMETEASVKGLYQVRSGVVHGGRHIVTREDVRQALNLVKRLIVQLSTHPVLRDVRSPKRLQEWVMQQKYGASTNPHT